MGHTLKIDDAVHCTSKEQYGRILDLAKKAGVPVYWNLRDNDWINYPFVGWDGQQLDGEDPCGKSDLNIIPEAEFVARMFGVDATPKDGPTIAILNGHVPTVDYLNAENKARKVEKEEGTLTDLRACRDYVLDTVHELADLIGKLQREVNDINSR